MAPVIVPFEFDESVFFGEGVQAMCHVPKGDTPLMFQWTMDGRDVSSLAGVNTLTAGDRGSVLIIPSATAQHSGMFACTASNVVANATHHSALRVKGIPSSHALRRLYPSVFCTTLLSLLASRRYHVFVVHSCADYFTIRFRRVRVLR